MPSYCLISGAISNFYELIPNRSSLSFSNKPFGYEKVEFCGCFPVCAVECICVKCGIEGGL